MSVRGISTSEAVVELLKERFQADTSVEGPPRIAPEKHLEVARTLRDEFGFTVFGFVVASHHPAKEGESSSPETLRVVYGLRSVGKGTSMATWQVEVPVGESVPSLVESFAGADWQEREQYDLLGVKFARHPDLRRLMLPEDWKGHPLRKDYAIDTEVPPWR
ncbi:MAG: NADH-quinone oxidoreductase subunit C [Polyangiaceae bacterium]